MALKVTALLRVKPENCRTLQTSAIFSVFSVSRVLQVEVGTMMKPRTVISVPSRLTSFSRGRRRCVGCNWWSVGVGLAWGGGGGLRG